MSITIREIAKISGFSRGTVSRALANPPLLIKEETRNKILAVARKKGYVKDINAQALGEGKSRDVGLIVPAMFISSFYRDFYSKLISSILYSSDKFGCGLRLILVNNSDNFLEVMSRIRSYKLRGLIMIPDWWEEFYKKRGSLKKLDIPLILLNNPIKGNNIMSVVLDDFQGGYDGTEYLIKLGHKKIAIFRGYPKDMEERFEGYKKAMNNYGLKINDKFLIRGVPDEKIAGYKNTKKVLGRKIKPTAIFCLGDDMAFSAMKAVKDMGLNCPKDVSILGYDGMEIGEYTSPRLTTMSRPVGEMGEKAVQLLLNNKNEKLATNQQVLAKIAERDSCSKK